MRSARVGIGLPVYNGERSLREAAESLLSQTFGDFELLIADNASTDATPEICAELVRRDRRVRYVRHPRNLGAARNFNFVFGATRGSFFKWAAHDDVCDPRLLERCLEGLEQSPDAVLCHAHSQWVDACGAVLGPVTCAAEVSSERASERFIAALELGYPAIIWGVMRREAVAATGLIGGFVNADRYFLAELLLGGPAEVVPETLLSVRRHDASFTGGFYRLPYKDRLKWFNPRMSFHGLGPMTAAALRLAWRISMSPMPLRERAACVAYLSRRVGGFTARRAGEFVRHQLASERPITPTLARAAGSVLAAAIGRNGVAAPRVRSGNQGGNRASDPTGTRLETRHPAEAGVPEHVSGSH